MQRRNKVADSLLSSATADNPVSVDPNLESEESNTEDSAKESAEPQVTEEATGEIAVGPVWTHCFWIMLVLFEMGKPSGFLWWAGFLLFGIFYFCLQKSSPSWCNSF